MAKLFAKHMKLPEQQKHLEGHVLGIGCGTPNRLLKLADVDALKLDRLRLLVLDVQLDAKQRWHPFNTQTNSLWNAPLSVEHIHGAQQRSVLYWQGLPSRMFGPAVIPKGLNSRTYTTS